jgi:hypothetical protein
MILKKGAIDMKNKKIMTINTTSEKAYEVLTYLKNYVTFSEDVYVKIRLKNINKEIVIFFEKGDRNKKFLDEIIYENSEEGIIL